ncbi:hypothetical protein [Actinomadura soli]|uniref:hypothetical protein n=1 Tax=Actinomadura soli TaxID=2508997 RepID=UPI001485E4B3|nr:hypothetical protein [Actinomadura soli]
MGVGVGGVPGLAWTPGQQIRLHVADVTAARTWVSGAVPPRTSVLVKPFWTPGKRRME